MAKDFKHYNPGVRDIVDVGNDQVSDVIYQRMGLYDVTSGAAHKLTNQYGVVIAGVHPDPSSPATMLPYPIAVDPNQFGVLTQDCGVAHHIEEGKAFSYDDVMAALAAAQDYIITTPNTADLVRFGFSLTCNGDVTVELYEGTSYTGAAAQAWLNMNRDKAGTVSAACTIGKGHTGGSLGGTRIIWRRDGNTQGSNRIAANIGSADKRVLARNTQYTFRVTPAASSIVGVEFVIYEHGASW
jgi:hypothetical protein